MTTNRTITRLSTFCGRCIIESPAVEVPSSSETIALVDALRSKGWQADDTLQVVICPHCAASRDRAPSEILTDDDLDTMAGWVRSDTIAGWAPRR